MHLQTLLRHWNHRCWTNHRRWLPHLVPKTLCLKPCRPTFHWTHHRWTGWSRHLTPRQKNRCHHFGLQQDRPPHRRHRLQLQAFRRETPPPARTTPTLLGMCVRRKEARLPAMLGPCLPRPNHPLPRSSRNQTRTRHQRDRRSPSHQRLRQRHPIPPRPRLGRWNLHTKAWVKRNGRCASCLQYNIKREDKPWSMSTFARGFHTARTTGNTCGVVTGAHRLGMLDGRNQANRAASIGGYAWHPKGLRSP